MGENTPHDRANAGVAEASALCISEKAACSERSKPAFLDQSPFSVQGRNVARRRSGGPDPITVSPGSASKNSRHRHQSDDLNRRDRVPCPRSSLP